MRRTDAIYEPIGIALLEILKASKAGDLIHAKRIDNFMGRDL